ncbi:hypothetical protein RchiOBHm_Chr6g0258721 [Rosa chinensis]|uniref:Uncharacterized protein n=1 Tax=Rosa chinensis TaxID=74649 RepID=A0A2P6PMP4_ROSCH|nr:hypothetical protein RchiOBHm_Chr6g0258721 [Rosa chinensis]
MSSPIELSSHLTLHRLLLSLPPVLRVVIRPGWIILFRHHHLHLRLLGMDRRTTKLIGGVWLGIIDLHRRHQLGIVDLQRRHRLVLVLCLAWDCQSLIFLHFSVTPATV